MKILTVAIPNHHFFQWVNQLEGFGYEVFWFDITDGGPTSEKIYWVKQIKSWKLRWHFPMRLKLKSKWPRLYKLTQKINEKDVNSAFAKAYKKIQPDIIHCFEMQLSGLPIFATLKLNNTPLIYSSWGSDLFDLKRLGISRDKAKRFLLRVDYLITDCKRDFSFATQNGFVSSYLGVFPGNGGMSLDQQYILPSEQRDIILIKGYEDGVGKSSQVLQALLLVNKENLEGKKIIIYSADRSLNSHIENSKGLKVLKIKVHLRSEFIQNKDLLKMMGRSCIHIANSISDGMPNALLEAMGMGAFPIQSNPGGATQEVITDGKNGLLINDPYDVSYIASLIDKAVVNEILRARAQEFNTTFIRTHYNRITLRPQIQKLYQDILKKHSK